MISKALEIRYALSPSFDIKGIIQLGYYWLIKNQAFSWKAKGLQGITWMDSYEVITNLKMLE